MNSDRFSAIILKQRALAYPCGRQLAGVQHEIQRDPSLQVRYILLVINLINTKSVRSMFVRSLMMNTERLFSVALMSRSSI